MPKGLQSSRPLVGAATRFHHDNRRCTFREELEHLRTLEFESFDLAGLWVERMKLEHLLGNVHPDDREFHFGFSLKNGSRAFALSHFRANASSPFRIRFVIFATSRCRGEASIPSAQPAFEALSFTSSAASASR